jgi:hypothetical protein
MVIKSVGVVSIAKIAGVLYAAIGLLIGGVFALLGVAGLGGSWAADSPDAMPFMGALFRVGAVVVLPIFYGVMGFVFALIGAAIFNAASRITGGVRVEVQ